MMLAVKSAIEGVKSSVTAKSDEYRGAYARESEKRYRTCVFVGTTNDAQFLVDKTGNRRFLPLECGVEPIAKKFYLLMMSFCYMSSGRHGRKPIKYI